MLNNLLYFNFKSKNILICIMLFVFKCLDYLTKKENKKNITHETLISAYETVPRLPSVTAAMSDA